MNNKPAVISNCQQIKANGLRCGSPAMNHSAFCFFHTDVRLRRRYKKMPLPVLEDANSVQLALNQLAARIMDESMDLKRTGQLLYLLQISAQNIARTRFEQLLDSLKRALARDYTPALEAEMRTLAGGSVSTPAAQADLESMYRHRDEWIKQQKESEAAQQPEEPAATASGEAAPLPTAEKKQPEADSESRRDERLIARHVSAG